MVLCGTLLKSVSAVGFSGKAVFFGKCVFYSQMLGATNFGLVLGDCIGIAMIFINKYFEKLSRISFYELVKIPIILIWAMCMPCIFYHFWKKKNIGLLFWDFTGK